MSRPGNITAALMIALGAACSGSSPSSPQPPGGQPGNMVANVTYCTGGGVPQLLDVYYPTTAPAPRYPVVVFIHGGQLIHGSKDPHDDSPVRTWREALAPRGYLLVSINYRLGPAYRFPAMIEDAKCAIRYLRANADLYKLDPNRIGVTGTSSGGYLAALVAVAQPSAGLEGTGGYPGVSSAVHAAVIEYGADMDLRQPAFSPGERESRQNAYPQPPGQNIILAGTVINHVSPDDPPFYFFHGDKDPAVDPLDNVAISDALNAVGVPSTFQYVINGGHGWHTMPFGPIMPSWPQILQTEIAFFDSLLKR